ncbi:unnamed protein product [Cylindrotheca closterium]|uniref:PCI domain-containing protein n=1 Tax=Cylindrotheca closterium TaxID=2856 RepID=A0AAD2FRI2_9STRA|nr:unnamed protein product [Cylindrotheca closterium]
MYSQYQSFQQQNPSTTVYSSSQPATHSHSNYTATSSHYSAGVTNNPQTSNTGTTALTVKPVEYYTTCYHGWNSQATKLEQQLRMFPVNNPEGKKETQSRLDWAKYYADRSSKAAHFFYQNPNATSAPFDLPPEPPKKASSVASMSPTKSNHAVSQRNQAQADPRRNTMKDSTHTPGSLENYVRTCLNQCKTPEQKKIVQSKVEIKIAEAIQKGDMHSRDWSREPVIPIPGSSSSSKKKKKKSKKDLTSDLSSTGSHYMVSGASSSASGGHYGPSSSLSSPNPSFSSYYYGGASEPSLSSQKRKSEDFIGFAKLNKKQKNGGKEINGFTTSSKDLARRANRFSGAGGIHDVAKSNLQSIHGHDKYMGKGMIGGSNVALDENDFERMTVKGTCTIMEKEYLRLTAPPRPELVRPEKILKKYLKVLKKHYSKPDHKDYLWFCSQLKAIRQDCTVQRIQNEFAVDVYETHARIALQEGDLNEYNQCQTQLQDLYRENSSIPNHEEFIAYKLLYYVLLSCNDQYDGGSSDMLKIMLSLNEDQRQHPAIEHALQVRECMALGNYLKFFRLHDLSPNLGDKLTSRIVPTMRLRGLRRMAQAYRPTLDARICTEHLGFDSLEEGKDWLVRCGCVLDGPKILMKDSVIHEPGEDTKNSLI